jgi:hypothetical protein
MHSKSLAQLPTGGGKDVQVCPTILGVAPPVPGAPPVPIIPPVPAPPVPGSTVPGFRQWLPMHSKPSGHALPVGEQIKPPGCTFGL